MTIYYIYMNPSFTILRIIVVAQNGVILIFFFMFYGSNELIVVILSHTWKIKAKMCPLVQNDERMVLPDNYHFMKAKTRHGNNMKLNNDV